MEYTKISQDESILADTQREAYEELRLIAREQGAKFEATLNWEVVKGQECLIQTLGAARKVIGTRAPHIEEFYENYMMSKGQVLQRISVLRGRIDDNRQKINRSLISRVPSDTAKVLRKLEKESLLGDSFLVSGLNCIFAFESHAKVRFKQDIKDRDVFDITQAARKHLMLLGTKGDEKHLFECVMQIDDSYKLKGAKGRYRLTNSSGFNLDLLCVAQERDDNWMLNVPRLDSIAFCEAGLPVPFVCLSPHVYALYKYWQSKNYQDKHKTTKAEIDSKQAYAITDMIKVELGECITEADYTAMPECIVAYKEQLASETEEAFGRTYEL